MSLIDRLLFEERVPAIAPRRIEPRFERTDDTSAAAMDFRDYNWSVPSAAGISINQMTAMQVTAVFACVSIISYDIAKLGISIFHGQREGARQRATEHFLSPLFRQPAPWLTWFEFCAMLQMSVLLRGNGYAVILRDGRGKPTTLVPINPDRVALWEAPDGSLWYMVTRSGLHEMAVLRHMPLLIPAEDIFHLKALTANGLLGLSPIAMAREAIGLAIAQEQLASTWAGNGAQPSGVLQTDQKLGDGVADRLKNDWQRMKGGIRNAGNTAILEQGLKWEKLAMTGQDMEFIASRKFQLEELARIFRIPLYKLGELTSRMGTNGITQQAQEYLNDTLSSHIEMWEKRIQFTFDIDEDQDETFVGIETDRLLRADIATRYAANRLALGGAAWDTANNIRAKEGLAAVKGGDVLLRPVNMAPIDSDVFEAQPDPNDPTLPGVGSDQTGEGAPGGGRPNADGTPAQAQGI